MMGKHLYKNESLMCVHLETHISRILMEHEGQGILSLLLLFVSWETGDTKKKQLEMDRGSILSLLHVHVCAC